MIEYGPHSGDSHNLFGLSCRSRSIACRQPAGFDRSKSFSVHRSAFNFAPCAVWVSRDVGEQNTSTKSTCFRGCGSASQCLSSVLYATFQFPLLAIGRLPEVVVQLALEQRRSFLAAPCRVFKRTQMANLGPDTHSRNFQ